jgi:nucleoside-diphosphate-sugar epimerase
MRILVTGANGYVARWVVPGLSRQHEVVLFARQAPGVAAAIPPGASFVCGALEALDDCRRAAEGVEAIVHLGGRPVPKPDTFRANVLGTYHVLEAAREMGVRRVVLASSMCVLDNCFRTSGRPYEIEYLPFDEAHPSRIEDVYGLSKQAGEQALEAFVRAGSFEGIALRLAWCWGPKEIEWRRREPLDHDRFKDGFWGYVDVRDAARAFAQAVAAWNLPRFGVYYVSAADTYADEPSADLLRRYYPQHAHLAAALKGHQAFYDWQAAHHDLGYAPQHSWRD